MQRKEEVMVGTRASKTGIVLLVIGAGLAGCDRSRPPTAPSAVAPSPTPPPRTPVSSKPTPAPSPSPAQIVVFTDPASGFSTSDVRDVDDELVRFNTRDDLIWVADGSRFPEFIANGNLIGYHHKWETIFHVRFGKVGRERRAYLTYSDDRLLGAPATIVDVAVDGRGDLKVAATTVVVPGS